MTKLQQPWHNNNFSNRGQPRSRKRKSKIIEREQIEHARAEKEALERKKQQEEADKERV